MARNEGGIECRNPNCNNKNSKQFFVQPFRKTDAFKGIIQFEETGTGIVKKIEMVLGPPVKIVCSCGHQVMSWIPNQAMLNTAVALQLVFQELAANRRELRKLQEQQNKSMLKSILKKFLPFLFSS